MTDDSEAEALDGSAATTMGVAQVLPPLWVSMALAMWGRALLVLSVALLAIVVAILGGVLVVLSPAAWTIDLMIALTGLPVAVAIPWVVGRALGAVSEGFVRGVTSTPLVAISPPPRPSALATPISTLRLSGLGPAVVALGALACLIVLGDVWAARMPLTGVRVGALAVTCDGLAALAALLLALGLAIGRIGRAVAAYESTVGARFFVLAVPPAAENTSGPGEIAVCAVPGLERA
jgi:hypothetical protein